MAELVHDGGEQIHPVGSLARRGAMEQVRCEQFFKLRVVKRRGIDEPAKAGGIVIQADDVSGCGAKHVGWQVFDP